MADPITAAVTAPWWAPPAIAAGGAIASGVISSAYNAFQAEKSRDWQRDMSDTAHQREVRDLEKAGLNPILSVKHGGASTPPGATAQASVPDSPVSSALQAAQLRNNLQLQEAQIRDINSAAALKDAERMRVTSSTQPQIDLMIAQKKAAIESGMLSWHQQEKVTREIRILELQRQHSAFDLHRAEQESKFHGGIGGKIAPWMKNLQFRLPGLSDVYRPTQRHERR